MDSLQIEQIAEISYSKLQTQCNTALLSGKSSNLPAGFPNVLDSQMSWLGGTYSNESSYAVVLDAEDLAELNNALAHFKCKFSSQARGAEQR